VVAEPGAAGPALDSAEARDELALALDSFDEPRAQALFDRLLAVATVDTVLSEVVLPYLHELGVRWERGEASVAQEHFASSVLRGRLLGLARGWGQGAGPAVLLACLPGEYHDLGLIAFGLALRARGWRIVYLGADAPLDTVEDAGRRVDLTLTVLHGIHEDLLRPLVPRLRALADGQRLAIAGPVAWSSELAGTDLVLLKSDPVSEAELVSRLFQPA
jgi:MerR family transcriptional regulator, light-induced transcriptional regulator